MGEENLTLETLRKVIDPYLQGSRRLQKELQDCLTQMGRDYSIMVGDYVIMHESLYEQLPKPRPLWLKGSRMINHDEAYIVRGSLMHPNQI